MLQAAWQGLGQVSIIGAGAGIFGVGWTGLLMTALFWFTVIIVFMVLVKFIWPPRAKEVIGQSDEGPGAD